MLISQLTLPFQRMEPASLLRTSWEESKTNSSPCSETLELDFALRSRTSLLLMEMTLPLFLLPVLKSDRFAKLEERTRENSWMESSSPRRNWLSQEKSEEAESD